MQGNLQGRVRHPYVVGCPGFPLRLLHTPYNALYPSKSLGRPGSYTKRVFEGDLEHISADDSLKNGDVSRSEKKNAS